MEFGDVADPPDVVAGTIGVGIGVVERRAGKFLANLDGFQHGAIAEAAATDVVDLAGARAAEKMIEGGDEIGAVDVVADLLAAVAENGVRRGGGGALYEVGEEAVQLRAAVIGAGEAAATEAGGFHAEVAAVLLHENVGGDFGCAEQAVKGVIDRHFFRDAVDPRVTGIDFPAGVEFDQRQAVGRVAVDFVGEVKMKTASGAKRRVASRTWCVPTALTVKSVVGFVAAQSCEGWAAV